jgi:hypothetical protein
MTWSVPREWVGDRCFILGGGPSLAGVDVSRLKGRIIAVNDAFLRRPDANVLFFADPNWLAWNHDERDDLRKFRGRHIVTRTDVSRDGLDIKCLRRDKKAALSRDPSALAGYCSGGNAINLAYLLGAAEIILLGFDMRPGHWHDRHKKPAPDLYATKFIPAIEHMSRELERDGVRVLNATAGSALTCFTMFDLGRTIP